MRLIALFVLTAGFAAFARADVVTNVWIGTDTSAGFTESANWAGGVAPTVDTATAAGWASTNAVFMFTNELDAVQTITYGQSPAYWHGIALGTLVSDPYRILRTYNANHMYMVTYDPSAFQGLLYPQGPLNGLELRIPSNSVTRLPSLYATYNTTLIARTLNATDTGRAEVGELWGRGRIEVGCEHTGADLFANQKTIGISESQMGRAGSLYVVKNGVVVMAGHSEEEPVPVSGAWLHLDASQASTLTVSDGRVTAWRDADGGSVVASVHASAAAPYYVTNAANGRAAVSFGAFKGPENGNKAKRAAQFGDPGALALSASTSEARELFVVFRDHEPDAAAPFFTGAASGYGFDRYAGAGYLFSSDAANRPLAVADVRMDGVRVLPNERGEFSHGYHVVSCGLKGSGSVASVGTDGLSRFGGLSIAELFVFTTELTAAERRAMNLHLRRKWLGGEAGLDGDFDRIALVGSGSFTVTGGTVRVHTYDIPSATCTKSGDGTLVLNRLTSTSGTPNLTVNAGAVRFEDGFDASTVRDDAPAADPLVWLDADCDSSLVKSNGTDGVYVTRWKDRRDGTNHLGTTVYAERTLLGSGKYSALPKIVNDTPAGKSALDFGEWSKVSEWGYGVKTTVGFAITYGTTTWAGDLYREVYEVVERTTDNIVAYIGNWGSSNGSKTGLYDANNAQRSLCDAAAAINGIHVTPISVRTAKDAYDVVRVSAHGRFSMNTSILTHDQNYAGGFRLAELIAYDRVLTEEERRNTEAYLLRKWRGESHPDLAARTLGTVTFASGVANTLGTDRDLTLAAVSGTATNLVFTGKGGVTVSGALPADYDSIAVGANDFTGPTTVAALFADCNRHFDASDAAALTTETDPNGATWVTKWLDVRRNGLCAAWKAEDGVANNTNKPWLVTATIGGAERQVVDFGEYCYKARGDQSAATLASTNTGTGFRLYSDEAATKAHWDSGYNEFYVVRRDRPGGTKFPPLLNCWDCTGRDATSGALFTSGGFYNNSKLRCLTMDGTNVSNTACVTDRDWHLFVFGSTVSGVAWRAFGKDWSGPNPQGFVLGGWQCAEVIGFKRPLGPERRRLLTAYLMKKWFNRDPDYSRHYDAVTMDGGGVTITGDFTNTVASTFGGKGTYAGPDVSGVRNLLLGGTSAGAVGALAVGANLDLSSVSTLAFDVASATERDTLTVTGTLKVPAAVSVTVNLADGLKLPGGAYPLVTAGTLEGSAADWTLVTTGGHPGRAYRLEQGGNAISLRVIPPGLTIMVW